MQLNCPATCGQSSISATSAAKSKQQAPPGPAQCAGNRRAAASRERQRPETRPRSHAPRPGRHDLLQPRRRCLLSPATSPKPWQQIAKHCFWIPANATARGNLLAAVNNWALTLAAAGRFNEAENLLAAGSRFAPEHLPFQHNAAHVQRMQAQSLNSPAAVAHPAVAGPAISNL